MLQLKIPHVTTKTWYSQSVKVLNTHRFESQYEKENVNYLIKMLYVDYIGHMLKRNDILPILGKRKYITKVNSLISF